MMIVIQQNITVDTFTGVLNLYREPFKRRVWTHVPCPNVWENRRPRPLQIKRHNMNHPVSMQDGMSALVQQYCFVAIETVNNCIELFIGD